MNYRGDTLVPQIVEGGEPVVVPNEDGKLTVPSVVSLTEDDVFIGVKAKRRASVAPLDTYYSVKRLIGQEYTTIGVDALHLAYEVGADRDNLVVLKSGIEGKDIYPEEISALVLSKLLENAMNYAGEAVTKAVISIPAYFNDEQKEATIAAGMMAGLKKVRLLREPIAAALAYGINVENDQTVLVFDLGGGTYDVSLLEVGGGVIEVLSTGGDPHLGGDDWDQAIVLWLEKEYLEPAGVNYNDPIIKANLKSVAEAAKLQLSVSDEAVIRMPLGGGIQATLTRQKLESLTDHLFRRARLPLDQACWQAGVDLGTAIKDWEQTQRSLRKRERGQRRSKTAVKDEGVQIRPKKRQPVSEILLVGGATRMPAVRKFVENMTGLIPKETNVDPDLAVAIGAAVQAGVFEGAISDVMIMDVWQASLMRAYATQIEEQKDSTIDNDYFDDDDYDDEGIKTSAVDDEDATHAYEAKLQREIADSAAHGTMENNQNHDDRVKHIVDWCDPNDDGG